MVTSAGPATTPDGRVPLRAPPGWEGRRPRRPQESRAQRTAPLPQGPLGGPCRRGPQGRAEHGRLYGTCNHTRWPGALASSAGSGGTASPPPARISGAEDCAPPTRSRGRDRVLAVRKSIGHAGPCLSRAMATLPDTVRNRPGRDGPHPGGPQEKAAPGARAEPAARLNRPVPLRAPTGWEGRRPRRPQQYRAQGTVPLPQGSHGRDRVLAVRKNAGRRGLRPSRTSFNRGHPSTLASPGGTASSGSAGSGL
jgi:hypothetical protein